MMVVPTELKMVDCWADNLAEMTVEKLEKLWAAY